MVAKRWAADDLGGHIMELLDQVAKDGPQTIQDGTGRLFDVMSRESSDMDKTSGPGDSNRLNEYLQRNAAERSGMTAEEIREDDEFYDEFQQSLDEIRREPDLNRERRSSFEDVEDLPDDEFERQYGARTPEEELAASWYRPRAGTSR